MNKKKIVSCLMAGMLAVSGMYIPTEESVVCAETTVSVETTDSGIIYTKDAEKNITITGYKGNATSVDLRVLNQDGNKVTAIGERAFSRTAITSIDIPETVTYIGENAFLECKGLTEITLPSQLTTIGNGAFSYCCLSEVTIPKNVTSIPANAFSYERSLKKVTFLSPDTTIPVQGWSSQDAFYGHADDFFICCDKKEDGSDSEAEKYAKQEGILFARPVKCLSIVETPSQPTKLFWKSPLCASDLEGLVLKAEYDSAIEPTFDTIPVKDCLISGYDAKKVGTQNVLISYGGMSVEYPVQVCYNFENVSVSIEDHFKYMTYTGEPVESKCKVVRIENGAVTLEEGKDYSIAFMNNTNASSKAKIVLTGMGDYSGEVERTFTIEPVDLQKAVFTLKGKDTFDSADVISDGRLSCVYTGQPVLPEFCVYYNGVLLQPGVDYITSATNNVEPGTSTLTIKGMGNFKNSKKIKFAIINENEGAKEDLQPKQDTENPSASIKLAESETTDFTITCKNKKPLRIFVKWSKQDKVAGYEVSYATNKKFTAGKKVKTTTKTKYIISKLKKGKTYYVRVRTYTKNGKKKVYGQYSSVKKVVVKK